MASSPRREWLGLQGHIQPLHSYSGLNRLREDKSDRNWFVIQDSNLHFYEHKRNKTPPDSQPLGNIDIAASVLEVFVVISRDGRDYQLSPLKDVCVFDWVTDLKEAVKLANTQHTEASPLERGVAGGSIMGKLRNSFRRKKKVTRALSENSTVGSHVNGPLTGSPRTHLLLQPMQKQEPEVKRPRSKSSPWEEPGSEGSSQSTLSYEETPKEPSVEQAEDCVLDSTCSDSYDKRLVETPTNKDLIIKGKEGEAKEETVKTESVEVQTDPITDEELLSFQQQKITKELEIEVCKLKCEVISLIQASIKIPLKDDDLADWQLIEDIRYKDRIYKLLSEARLYNPSLPDFDGCLERLKFLDEYAVAFLEVL